MELRRFIAALLLIGSIPAYAAEVSGLRVWSDPDKTRAVIDLDTRTDYQLFTLEIKTVK